MTRVLIIGGNGTIGAFAAAAVRARDPSATVLIGGRKDGQDVSINIGDPLSVQAAFDLLASDPVDHIICTAGAGLFKPIAAVSRQDLPGAFHEKVYGQMDVVLSGIRALKDGGSITLTSGCLDRYGIPVGAFASSANAAINAFVKTAANEMPRGIRLNIVSPGLLTESVPKYGPYFAGFIPVDGKYVGQAYVRSVFSNVRGTVFVISGAPTVAEE